MTTQQPYRDRRQAGHVLAEHVAAAPIGEHPIVLGLARGGVPVAEQVAEVLDAPLDVLVVRKLGFPSHPELAMGALASGGVRLLDETLINSAGLSADEVERVIEHESHELERRESLYRDGRPPLDPRRRSVVLVDDGLATGFSMRAAIAAMRKLACGLLTAAVPVGARASCAELAAEADGVICPLQPEPFHAVGIWYEDFMPTADEEVKACLARHAHLSSGRHERGSWL